MVERQCYFGNDAIANLNRNPSNARLQWWWPAWMAAALQATTASHSLRQVIQPLQPFVDKECRSGMMDQGRGSFPLYSERALFREQCSFTMVAVCLDGLLLCRQPLQAIHS
uniref:Uncharacterized protein LOC105049634 isoform X7 n=1 Tax=Elaeis guineensis var. tenera TaxID=51953 RepID=A0A8N4IEZ3_ELAGV|nr:uncharacterized protein LOC105049634 isoform X7 [Elaeis guineensis]